MKKILLAIFILTSAISKAQLYTPEMSRSFPYVRTDSGFALQVRDTVYTRGVKRPGLLTVRPQDSLLYIYTGTKWREVGVDSTGLTAKVNLKVDSVKVLTDTLFYYINGVGHGNVFSISAAYPTALAFDTATGIFTLSRNGLSALTQDLDGRYDTSGHQHTSTEITDFTAAGRALISGAGSISYNSTTGVITSTGLTGADTTSLSNRINAKLNISDTSAMLSNYQDKLDEHSDSLANVVKLRDSTNIYYPYVSNPKNYLITTNAVSGNTILTGGQVTWISGLTYYVSPTTYVIGGVQYTFAGGNVTLAAADPTDPRQDAIILNTSSASTSVTGVPDANPLVPTEDPATQVYLTSGYIAAGATTPSNISQVIIRDEGSGGEWTITKTLTSTDNYATNPYNGTISQRITAATNNQYIQWTKPSGTISKSQYTNLIFFIRNNVTFNNNRNLLVQLFNGTTQVGTNINLSTYGYSKVITGAYGTIAIPLSAFTGADLFDNIRLVNTGTGGTVDVQVDYIQLQAGVSNGGSSGGSVTNVSVVSANGLAGTVANSTTTPAITLSTSVTGVLKGNGTAISAAVAGTDYQAPITLTTTGTSGAATLVSNTLNIPQYTTATPGIDAVLAVGQTVSLDRTINVAFNKKITIAGERAGLLTLDNQDGSALNVTSYSGSGAIATFANLSTGQGISVTTGGARAGLFYTAAGSTNTVIPVFEVSRHTTGTAANGIGGSIDFTTTSSTSSGQLSNQLISKWSDATHATRTSEFKITGVNSGTTADKFIVKGSGVINIPTALGNYADNAAAIAAGLVAGDLYRNGDVLQVVH